MSAPMTLSQIADSYLTLIPTNFEAMLRRHEATDKNCSLVLSALLAGTLKEDWARDHATPEVLTH